MKTGFLLLLIAIFSCSWAQLPVAKVDINMEGRGESEVNQEGYTPWYITRVPSSSITVSGITFELRATSPKDHTSFRTSWAKALVQTPYLMRLVADGVKIDNDSLVKYPGNPAAFEMHISGLPKGKHMLQTYHNIWEDTTKVNHAPMNVYMNNTLLFEKVNRSVKVTKVSEATILPIELDVKETNQTMVIRFEADTNFTSMPGKTADWNVCINAFELNTSDATRQANEPVPTNGDYHVNADSGFFILRWDPAINNLSQTHTVYFGTDSATVADATPANASVCKGTYPLNTTSWKAEGLYNMNTYFWRVDQTDSTGTTTKGKIWRFRIRQVAFPGAEGYGRYAIGGRGGKVVYVTNLNDSGEGSFRYAVENIKGPRTILFSVSGLLTLNSRLVINDDFITVAGQTAPGKGVCIRWAPVGVTGDDLIVQHLRVRMGIGITYDGMGLTGADHSIIDHSSISWTIDEAFSSRGAKNITLQRTLISEALNEAGHDKYGAGKRHGFAASIGGDVGSFHHNLLAHCAGRNWSLAGGLDGYGFYSGRLDIRNNVVYNWNGRTTDGGAHEVNFVGNFYKKGPACDNNYILTAQLEGVGKGTQSYFYTDNIMQNTNGTFACDGTKDDCARNYQKASSQIFDWELWVSKPFFPSYVADQSAKAAFKTVLSDVGCTQPAFDDHDKRMVHETLNGSFSLRGSKTKFPGLPDHESDAGGWETYPGFNRAASWDTDLDGLPDWWEKARGLDPNSSKGDFSDSNADNDKNGYTNLEEYLHWMSEPHYFIKKGETVEIDLGKYAKGFTLKPVFEVSGVENGNVSLQSNSTKASFTPTGEGFSKFGFTVTDSEGDKMSRTINIFTGELPADVPFAYTYFKDRANTQLVTVDKSTSSQSISTGSLQPQIEVYPNPANNQLTIRFHAKQEGKNEISISNMVGQSRILQKADANIGENQTILDVSSLSNGVYILTIKNKHGSKSVRFIKQ